MAAGLETLKAWHDMNMRWDEKYIPRWLLYIVIIGLLIWAITATMKVKLTSEDFTPNNIVHNVEKAAVELSEKYNHIKEHELMRREMMLGRNKHTMAKDTEEKIDPIEEDGEF